jgi:hypothetical protein
MSRVFDNNAANFLEATGNLVATAQDATLGIWIKDDSSGGFQRAWMGVGASGTGGASRRYINTRQTGIALEATIINNATSAFNVGNVVTNATWILVSLRILGDGIGGWTYTLWSGGVLRGTLSGTEAAIIVNNSNIVLGQTASGSIPTKGKAAHAFAFTRALSDAEMLSVGSGDNPSSLAPTGRYAYYPMTGTSLVNEWEANSGVGSLVVSGTVANDGADNPTVSSVSDTTAPIFDVAPNAVITSETGHTITSTLDEGGTIYGVRLASGATAPSSAQAKAGQNNAGTAALEAVSVAATAATSADLTFSTGAASTAYDYYIVAEDDETTPNLQATPTLVSATTAAAAVPGIGQLTVQFEGVAINVADWHIITRLAADQSILYNQTGQSSDASGNIAAFATTSGSVGDPVRVEGLSAADAYSFVIEQNLGNIA